MEIVSAQELPNPLRYFYKIYSIIRQWAENKSHNSTCISAEFFLLEIVLAQ